MRLSIPKFVQKLNTDNYNYSNILRLPIKKNINDN